MFMITCPHCGKRPNSEFRFGGEILTRPAGGDAHEWFHYVYARKNVAGVQAEWWYHRAGCQSWFRLKRDTLSNQQVAE